MLHQTAAIIVLYMKLNSPYLHFLYLCATYMSGFDVSGPNHGMIIGFEGDRVRTHGTPVVAIPATMFHGKKQKR